MKRWAVVVIAACGCKGKAADQSTKEQAKPIEAGPLRVSFGDCTTNQGVAFVSGPKPQKFDPTSLEIAERPDDAPYVSDPQPWQPLNMGRSGTMGTIGQGAGTGYGIGGRLGGHTNLPSVTAGAIAAQGDLDKAIIRRYVRRNIQKIQYCYEKELLAKPNLEGTIKMHFVIDSDGHVSDARAESTFDRNVSDCVERMIRLIEFPKPQGGGVVNVNYPFRFRTAGSSGGAALTGTAGAFSSLLGSAVGSGDVDAGVPVAAAAASQVEYVPGSDNPLRAFEAELIPCLRKQPKPFGALVVTIDPAGRATRTFGESEAVRACVTEVARNAERTRSRIADGTTPLRCSVAFGTMSINDAPSLDITENAILWGGKVLGDPRVLGDPHALAGDPMTTLAPLEAALYDHLKKTSGEVVSISGPTFLRPAGETRMQVITRVLFTANSAGADLVLAAKKGDWVSLRKLELPVPPVPSGTGGMWSRRQTRAALGTMPEHRTASVLVTPTGIHIAMNDGAYREGIDINDRKGLAEALVRFKAKAPVDVEVAAEGTVQYEAFVPVIEALNAAGLEQWIILGADALSTRLP